MKTSEFIAKYYRHDPVRGKLLLAFYTEQTTGYYLVKEDVEVIDKNGRPLLENPGEPEGFLRYAKPKRYPRVAIPRTSCTGA